MCLPCVCYTSISKYFHLNVGPLITVFEIVLLLLCLLFHVPLLWSVFSVTTSVFKKNIPIPLFSKIMILHYGKKALVTTDAFSWISMGFSKRICTASTATLIHKIHVDIHKFLPCYAKKWLPCFRSNSQITVRSSVNGGAFSFFFLWHNMHNPKPSVCSFYNPA